jgi:hypothetical protein
MTTRQFKERVFPFDAKQAGGGRRTYREFAAAAAVCLLSVGYLYRHLWLSRFDSLPGDLGDARLCMVLLEHWWAACRGLVSWKDPNFFAPTPDILGYSDTLFLHALIYIPFRIAYLDTYLSFALAIVVLRALGFVFCYWLSRETLEFSVPVSLLCACLFTIANINPITSIHAQLLNFEFVPLQAVLIGRYLRRRSVVSLAGAACLTGAMLFTDVYEVVFGFLAAASLVMFWLAAGWLRDRASLRSRLRLWSRHGFRDLAVAAPFFLVWLGPFWVVYWPVYQISGGRTYPEVLQFIRDWREILDVGPDNVVWGSTLGLWFARRFPETGEPHMGISPGMAIAAAAITAIAVLRLFAWRPGTLCRGDRYWRTMIPLGASLGALYVLSVRFGIHSLWWLVFHCLPGAKAIRATNRINMLVVLGATLVCGLAMEWLLAETTRKWARAAVIVFAAGLCAEQINRMDISGFSRSSELAYFARFPAPPADCARFFVFDPRQPELSFVGQMDAMVLARRINLATINGYSGLLPAGFDISTFDPNYLHLVSGYLAVHHIWNRTCALDLEQARWYDPSQTVRLLQETFPDHLTASIDFKAGGNARAFQAGGWSSPETIGTWTDGPTATLVVRGIKPARGRLTIRAVAEGFCASQHPLERVTVLVNDERVAEWTFTAADHDAERVAQAPLDSPGSPVTLIRFDISHPASPHELGLSADTRKLGMLVKQITLSQNP